jgi:hypothetical protein
MRTVSIAFRCRSWVLFSPARVPTMSRSAKMFNRSYTKVRPATDAARRPFAHHRAQRGPAPIVPRSLPLPKADPKQCRFPRRTQFRLQTAHAGYRALLRARI